MARVNVVDIESQLREDEGEILHEYKDSLGYSTIGIGILIDRRKGGGITKEESSMLFNNRLNGKREELRKKIPWFDKLDEARQGVLLNMVYQLGVDGLMKFQNTLKHVEAGNWKEAGTEMLNSAWANQTPQRARRLSRQMVTGVWQ